MSTTGSTQLEQRKRGGCLTAILILMLIGNPLLALYYLFAGSSVAKSLPTMPGWTIPVLGLLGIVNFVCAFAIWKWKRWGMYGFAATSVVTFFINIVSIGFLPALLGLVGVVVLGLLVRPVWSEMD